MILGRGIVDGDGEGVGLLVLDGVGDVLDRLGRVGCLCPLFGLALNLFQCLVFDFQGCGEFFMVGVGNSQNQEAGYKGLTSKRSGVVRYLKKNSTEKYQAYYLHFFCC